jgi:hypothetical protein
MDDGSKHSNGSAFYLCTDSFTLDQVELLVNILKSNFALECSIHKKGKGHRIYIKACSMDRFRSIVAPNFHDSLCNISLRSCLFFNLCINKGGGSPPLKIPLL